MIAFFVFRLQINHRKVFGPLYPADERPYDSRRTEQLNFLPNRLRVCFATEYGGLEDFPPVRTSDTAIRRALGLDREAHDRLQS